MALAVNTHAYLYLLREREFVLRGEHVYKIGMTKQKMDLRIHRFEKYKNSSELVLIVECALPLCQSTETSLKREFCQKFIKHNDGTEYFIGNCREMAAIIFQAANLTWTEQQESFKKVVLENVISMETYPGSAAQIEKKEIADTAARRAEQAAREADLFSEEERNLTGWFDECVTREPSNCVKQSQWYSDYRSWADRAGTTPLTEGRAVATFKRLHPEISVGQKTYGIKLLSQEPVQQSVTVPLMSKWLVDLVTSDQKVSRVMAMSLMSEYVQWCRKQDPPVSEEDIDSINKTNFGTSLKKYQGVKCDPTRRGSEYTFNCYELQKCLIDLGHHVANA